MSQSESTAIKQVTVGGTSLHRVGAGNSQAVIFLHGSGPGATAWSNWQYALPVFGQRYDALAPDLVGFGRSHHPDPPPDSIAAWMRLWVNQVVELLDSLGLESADLVGNSLGGAIALQLLAEHPGRFRRAVLMGPAGVPTRLTRELDVIWGFFDDPSEARMRQIITWFSWHEGPQGEQLDAIAKMRFEAAMSPDVRRSFRAMFPAPRQRILDELVVPDSALRRIKHPVLIVHGLNDGIVSIETSHHLVSHLGGPTQLHVYNQCSHWTQIEYRDSFHRLLEAFFEGSI